MERIAKTPWHLNSENDIRPFQTVKSIDGSILSGKQALEYLNNNFTGAPQELAEQHGQEQ